MKKNNLLKYISKSLLFIFFCLVFYIPTTTNALINPNNIKINSNNLENEQQIKAMPHLLVGSSTNCTITSISSTATNNTIAQWSSTTISWNESGCTTLQISSSDGTFTNTSVVGEISINTGSLGSTTSYYLVGSDSSGNTSTKAITITVQNTVSTNCQLYSFNVNGSNNYAQIYYGNTAILNWSASSGCTNISISGNNGAYFSNLQNQTSISVGPFYSNVTYTINAYGINGQNQSLSASVYVNNTGSNWNNNYYNNSCTITDFHASSNYIASGQSVTLSWSTIGCYYVNLTSSSGNLPINSYYPTNGSVQTNAIYGTTIYSLSAEGGNNSSTYPSVTVYVTGGPYAYNNTSSQIYGQNALTSIATNVGAYSAKVNGIIVNTTYPATAWFEYGTDSSLGQSTTPQIFQSVSTTAFSDTIYTNPSTTYYYRAVTEVNGTISRGDIMTFETTDQSDTTTYITTNSNSTNGQGNTSSGTASNGVSLAISNTNDKIYVGDTVDYKISYANNTKKNLSKVMLNLVLPQGFEILQTTQGQVVSPTIITVNIGSLTSGANGNIFVQAKVGTSVSLTDTLVTNGTLSFAYPNGTHDSTIGYVLNHAVGVSALGGFAFGAGFFPTTILGWFVTILIILAVILTIRRIAKASGGSNAHH